MFLLELFDLKIFDKRGDLKSLCKKKDYFVIIQTLTELKLAGIKSYLYKRDCKFFTEASYLCVVLYMT